MTTPRSYHDLFITTPDIERTSISDLPFPLMVTCSRLGGWELWSGCSADSKLLAGEYHSKGIKLECQGVVLVNTLEKPECASQ
ncbi:hypothetical protein [Achromobacter phage Motura]|uniref:Uncharacterized protein n=1 Tax=Achromobacter phage Motura TaxID=2591403 RepID=A0A514CT63_9CAUD|nr:hypothetical protein H1O15_gp087 [Achromobacter phage Motura]QDH83663.1 hypothetical protein [Achromobacter phage Motura]